MLLVVVVLDGAACRAPATDEVAEVEAAGAAAPEPAEAAVPADAPPPEVEAAAPGEPQASPPEVEAPLVVPEAPPPEPPPRLVQSKCARKCKRVEGSTCVSRARPGVEPEPLGCGEVGPTGRYAVLRRTRGRGEDAGLVYEYIDAEGTTLRVDEGSCAVQLSADCEGPGSFLALEPDGWIHRIGNAGDGSNDQALWHVVSGQRYELPEGEYGVVEHPGGKRVGFFAMVPNDEAGGWRTTLACFDVEHGTLHRVWKTRLHEPKADRYFGAEVEWDGDALVVRGEGKVLRRAVCPAE